MLGLLVTQILSQSRAQPSVSAGMEEIFVTQEASAAAANNSFVFSSSSPSQGRDRGSAVPQARVGPAGEVLVPQFQVPHLEG